MIPTCGNCGASVDPGFRFCPDCGYAVGPEAGQSPRAADDALTRLSGNMPDGMAQKIRASRGMIEGERKQVTVLFCDLVGSTAVAERLDPEEYHELLEQYLALAFREVYRFEGIVNQLAGDGLMALFGAPIAHEDAPQRAVWAALAIRDALDHFNRQLEADRGLRLPARIGINTGPVVVGTVGNDLKMDYTAIGDTTNLAARLEELASPGAVLVSETTARLVRGFFRMRSVGPVTVKGKNEPVTTYEIMGVSEAESSIAVAAARGLTPLVGRNEEIAQLEACYRRLAGNLTQLVAVVGDAGSGKSRLLHEFRQRLADEPVVFFEARCSALHRLEPYFPFVVMLRQYFELTPDDSAESACERIARKVQSSCERLDADFPLLRRLLSLSGEGPSDLPLEQLKRETFQAIGNLVLRESRQAPVVMLIEDLHWIDEESQELLEMAVTRLDRARVMILVSHRPEYRPSWRTSAALTQLKLRPLPDGNIKEILRSLTGRPLPEDLEQLILRKAEGSPFFAEEITRALIEEGHVTCDASSCRLTRAVEDIPIPGTVQEVLAARLDRLGAPAKRIAQVAAVLGRQFSRRQLEQLLMPEKIDVERGISELEQRGVIHRQSMFSSDEHRFGESLTQEVAYESLLLKQRRELHERVGLMLESGGGEAPPERPSLIAHHFALSDNREKALQTLLRAAVEAERLPSYRAALDLYRQAWELADVTVGEIGNGAKGPLKQLVAATLGYSRVTVMYGYSADPEARRAAQRGRELAEELGDQEAVAAFYTFEGMMLTADRERFGEGLSLVERGVAVAEHAGAQLQVISISRGLAWNYMLDGRFQLARSKFDSVIAELERLGHGEELSDVYLGSRTMRDAVRFHEDDLGGALRGATETHELSVRASNRTVQSHAAGIIAHVHFMRGDYEEARRWADESVETAEAIGSLGGMQRAGAVALAARVELGEELPRADYVELIEEALGKGGNVLLSVGAVVESFLTLGDVRRAERIARTAYERSGGRLREMLSAAAMGDATLQLGRARWAEAEQWHDQALSAAEALGSPSIRAVATCGKGRLALLRGDREVAAQSFERALVLCRETGLGRYARRAEQLLGEARTQGVRRERTSPATGAERTGSRP